MRKIHILPILVFAILMLICGCSSIQSQYGNTSGVQLFAEGNYAEALVRFQSAIDSNPNDADSYYNIAAVHHHLARINRDANQNAQAEANYKLCFSKNPNHTSAYRGYAVWLMENHRRKEAFELLEQWSNTRLDIADPKIELGRLHQETGNTQKAIDYLSAAIAIEPKSARAHAALGYLRESLSEWDQAILNYRYSLECNPNQPDLSYRLAQIQAQRNSRPAQ